jgi:hypothetical protein
MKKKIAKMVHVKVIGCIVSLLIGMLAPSVHSELEEVFRWKQMQFTTNCASKDSRYHFSCKKLMQQVFFCNLIHTDNQFEARSETNADIRVRHFSEISDVNKMLDFFLENGLHINK